MTRTSNEKTFVRITNKDIYDKITELTDHVKTTNGKVKLNRWIASTALSIVLILIGFMFKLAMPS